MLPPDLKRLTRYALVGILNTGCDFLVFAILFFGLSGNMLAANSVAFVCAATQSYFINALWTFKQRWSEINAGSWGIFLAINLMNLVLSNIVLYWLAAAVPVMLAKIGTGLVLLVWSYFVAKHFVFTAKEKVSTNQTPQSSS